MKTTTDKLTDIVVGFLWAVQLIRDDVKNALDDLDDNGKELRKDKQSKPTLSVLKHTRATLATAHKVLAELYGTMLSSSPALVRKKLDSGEDIDTSPEGVKSLQAQMRGYLEHVGDNPARMACEAACTAADVMLRAQLSMIDQTYKATESIAAQARDEAIEAVALVYQDTCMQALEACSAAEETSNGQSKRTLQ